MKMRSGLDSMTQNKRVTGKEQYYTPLETACHCLKVLQSKVDTEGKLWLEPAGGTGSFVEALLSSGISESLIRSYDIEPKHRLVTKTDDFLKESLSDISNAVTLTNPPFGRANKLSVPFFNKCSEVSDYVAFVVPKSWRKWSVQDRLNPLFHVIHDEELQVDYTMSEGNPEKSKGKLATVFQIWERREGLREKVNVEDRGYIKKCSPLNADVALTVFGRGCGKLETEFDRKPNTTKMFLKVKNPSVLNALASVDFSRFYNNVAFVEALSIKEIMFLLDEFFDSGGNPEAG